MTGLEAAGSEKVRAMNTRNGATQAQFGVKMGDIRAIAKRAKLDHPLGLALWNTGNLDAMFLATLVMRPKELTAGELDSMVRSLTFNYLADWFMTNVVKQHPAKEELRQRWMTDSDPMIGRAAWSLTTERVIKKPEGLDLVGLLDRIEAELAAAPESAKWTMNYCLAEIGINFPEHRERALEMGERLGVYRDFPTSKGCTSPFAPIWIGEMVKRQAQ